MEFEAERKASHDAQVMEDLFDLLDCIKRHFKIPDAKYYYDNHKHFLKPLFKKYDDVLTFLGERSNDAEQMSLLQREHYHLRVSYDNLEKKYELLKNK